MTMQTSTLRPGLLVGLKTSVTGNVRYTSQTIESDHVTDDGARKAKWETERTVSDPVEHEAALKARSKARQLISSVCANSAFGLLCPENAAERLEAAVQEAQKLAREFNQSAKLTRLNVYVITGRIAPDDVEAVRAINGEVRDLMEAMASGVNNLDAKAIRDAASRARQVGMMLSPDAESKVRLAIDAARAAASKIVKAGEQAAQDVDKATIRYIESMRTSFLDLDGDGKAVEAPAAEARSVDFEPGSSVAVPKQTAAAVELEGH